MGPLEFAWTRQERLVGWRRGCSGGFGVVERGEEVFEGPDLGFLGAAPFEGDLLAVGMN